MLGSLGFFLFDPDLARVVIVLGSAELGPVASFFLVGVGDMMLSTSSMLKLTEGLTAAFDADFPALDIQISVIKPQLSILILS